MQPGLPRLGIATSRHNNHLNCFNGITKLQCFTKWQPRPLCTHCTTGTLRMSADVAAVVAALSCQRCGAPAKLQCPNCLKLGLPKESSSFCSQECFKLAWGEHKKQHKPTAEAWQYVTKRGKGRQDTMPGFDWTGPLRPYRVSPMRTVPDHVPRPDYADSGVPQVEIDSRQQRAVAIRNEEAMRGIRAACLLGREILDEAHRNIRPGVTTDEIDRIVHDFTVEHGAYPSPLNYYNFPKSVCTSINEVICHGIPDARELRDGDIVNVDVSCYLAGYHGDLNETFCVGNMEPEYKQLIKVTHDCMMKAISSVKPGMRYRDIGEVIQNHARQFGFQVVKTYCGHGIGDLFHCAPNIPHYAHNKAVGVMKVGEVFTIEPMINMGSWRDKTWPDGWTSVTEDGKRSAQFEHQVLVTAEGAEVLTKRLPTSPPLWWEVEGAEQAMEGTAAAAAQTQATPDS